MKNISLLIFFSLLSLFLLVILIILAFLPKLCYCFNAFCNKNYKTIIKRNTRARRIKRARLRLLYKSQVSHEKPIQKELDRSKGVFFEQKLQQKIKDEESLAYFKSNRFETSLTRGIVRKRGKSYALFMLQKVSYGFAIIRKSVKPGVRNLEVNSRFYLTQFRNFLASSVAKYLNH